jgi:hypothetical protein
MAPIPTTLAKSAGTLFSRGFSFTRTAMGLEQFCPFALSQHTSPVPSCVQAKTVGAQLNKDNHQSQMNKWNTAFRR